MPGANHNGAKIIIGTEITYETQHQTQQTVQEINKFSRKKSDDEATGKTKGGYKNSERYYTLIMTG